MTRFRATPQHIVALVLLAAFAFLYRDVITKLVSDWSTDDNYSHGFLIVPVALYFAWERRQRVLAAPMQPSVLGLIVILGSLATLVAGVLGAELFLTRVSMIGVLAGSILFVLGWQHLRVLAFPIAFLLLIMAVPQLATWLPSIVRG